MPTIKLSDDAINLLLKYRWSGNIRQLRNVAEQVSVLEQNRTITAQVLDSYYQAEIIFQQLLIIPSPKVILVASVRYYTKYYLT